MTRREFLKKFFTLMIGLTALYITRVFNLFKTPSPSQKPHDAKFYREADDLAG